MIRLFVALPLPAPARQRLALLAGGVPGARWVKPENYHVTLRFLGEVDEGLGEDCVEALDRVAARGFPFAITGAGLFGQGERARVLYAGIEAGPAMEQLHGRIESALVRAGLPPEGRKFTPHVTLAYLKGAPPDRVAGFLQMNQLLRVPDLAAERMVLYSSWPTSEGAVYQEEASWPLREAA